MLAKVPAIVDAMDHFFAHTVLLDRCSGKTRLLIRDENSSFTNKAWHPLHRSSQ